MQILSVYLVCWKRQRLSFSQVECDMLTVKMNCDESSYLSEDMMIDQLIQNGRSVKYLQKCTKM